ncbi:MAG: thioredoxin domain-containing protein [Hydrogenimonas sp.]|nr:thioredoxin domain-containing protein [Hydrogenimonas sp.]
MSSMLRFLTILIIGSSFLFASGDADVVNFVKKKLAQNKGVKILSVKVADKLPIPGVKGWSAYVMEADLELKRGKESRKISFETILFVSKNLITTELVDRKTGRDIRSILQPKLPEDIYSKSHLLYGNEDAKHKLILFSDPLCPFCRMYVPGLMKAVKENPDKLALYYYHLPLSAIHPASDTLVRVMEVAKKRGDKSLVEKLYSIDIDPDLKDEKKILEIVEKKTGFKTTPSEIHDKKIEKIIAHDRIMARKLLVTGTPTIFADGKKDITREKYKSFIKK